ncbi:hypothetical protein [Costertonia aggregata]|uniref:Uncharacterized protein n=1 Tax=Costertonia aggregata TaxID=343403 RepID=A0A7H9AU27_9FLAO|nr:hypothetical protein [Costertonia aggregata]QLG46950.1 hypothetical protein HYG79_16845 [Costertonia aggregata]
MKVQKYTIMERFEPDIMYSASKRKEMKESRLTEVKKIVSILDTIKISKTKKEKLLRDLIQSPFSERLRRTIADLEFEDANENP